MLSVRKNLFLILSIALCIFAILALFHPGFFPIHDDEQIARLHELNYDVQSLHIPPRLSQNLGFGYDYPFFNFYPSFVYWVAEIFKFVGFSYIASVKIMIGLGFILSSVFMYLFARNYFGKLGALVAATLYVYAPYHSVDVYVRGALPEFWSFVFIPAIFWTLFRIYKENKIGNILLLGFFGSCLIYTHNLVAMMSVPFIGIYFLYLLFSIRIRKAFTFSVICSGILAILLSAFFSIPAILENKYTMVNLLTTQLADYHLHFVSLTQFFNSPWGYGGSILGPQDGLSLEVGKIHIGLILISSLIFAYLLLKKKTKKYVLIPFIFIFVLSLFLQSYYSRVVWDLIPPFSYIQFPWRFMLFSVFSSAFIAGYIFSLKFNERLKYTLAFALIVGSIIFYANLFKPSKYLTNARDTDYVSQSVIRWKTSNMAFEYVPKGISTKSSSLGTTVVNIKENEVAKGSAKVLSGAIVLETLSDKPQYKKLDVFALTPGVVRLNTFSFPGWEVFINGVKVGYNDDNKLRLITIKIKKGNSVVEAKFVDTNVRRISNLLTLAGIFIVIFLLPKRKRKIKI